jgi:hypothetical protein
MKNPAECWSAGVMGKWSNLVTHLSAVLSAVSPRSCSAEALRRRKRSEDGSKPVKASQSVFQSLPLGHGSSRHRDMLWSLRPNAQPMAVYLCCGHQCWQAIRNPHSARKMKPQRTQRTQRMNPDSESELCALCVLCGQIRNPQLVAPKPWEVGSPAQAEAKRNRPRSCNVTVLTK